MGGRGRRISEFEASLVYRKSSRTARATQRNPVSKKPNQDKTNKQNNKNKKQLKEEDFLKEATEVWKSQLQELEIPARVYGRKQ